MHDNQQDIGGVSLATDGAGRNGQWVFADLPAIDAVIKKWTDVRDKIKTHRDAIRSAIALCTPPAADLMSQMQAQATRDSLHQAYDKCDAMFGQADNYVLKLTEARKTMAATEQENAGRFHGGGR